MKPGFLCEGITPIPPDGEMCQDCAFRPGSPERDPEYKGVRLDQVKAMTESFLENGVPCPYPFTCHAGMQPDGKGSFVKYPDPRDPRWRVCEGWKRLYGARQQRAMEE